LENIFGGKAVVSKFHERFEIDVNMEQAKERFVNRAYNSIFYHFFTKLNENDRYNATLAIASALGRKYKYRQKLENLIGSDFYNNLHALEAMYVNSPSYARDKVEQNINRILEESETDMGVRWENGKFIKTGAKLLDEKLVNISLNWLRNEGYENVFQPFEKGLEHFLNSEKNPALLSDVITDMYEALEALAKIVTERDKDLSANAEIFIKNVKASDSYKIILKDYIKYANDFRHAAQKGETKPELSEKEAESFIYLTGIFIRLAME
jgi:hypothetical protein